MENVKMIWEIINPAVSAIIAGFVAWIFRGKIENKKQTVEIDRLAVELRKEEIQFRDQLMTQLMETQKQLVEVQKQVVALEQTVYQQSLEIERLNNSLNEKDLKLKKYESNS